jgi:hypothetical protein
MPQRIYTIPLVAATEYGFPGRYDDGVELWGCCYVNPTDLVDLYWEGKPLFFQPGDNPERLGRVSRFIQRCPDGTWRSFYHGGYKGFLNKQSPDYHREPWKLTLPLVHFEAARLLLRLGLVRPRHRGEESAPQLPVPLAAHAYAVRKVGGRSRVRLEDAQAEAERLLEEHPAVLRPVRARRWAKNLGCDRKLVLRLPAWKVALDGQRNLRGVRRARCTPEQAQRANRRQAQRERHGVLNQLIAEQEEDAKADGIDLIHQPPEGGPGGKT